MARRPAPVQVTYLGYPNTTGIRAIDFRLTDAYADPPGSSERWYVERLMYMPDSFLCYTPVETDLPIQPGPRERAGRVTFGSFNNFQKISPTCVALWSRVLQAVPDAQLFVKTRGLDDPGLVSAFKGRFEQHGVAGDRVRVAPATTSHREHLRQYEEVDLALDTFPYHGTTTTLDALWMGVPVVTLAGERHASRVGVSILSNLGLDPLLVASTPDEFVARAATLASQPATLDELRRTLRGRLQASVLLDGRSFTAKLEATYLQMWDSVVDRP
jgi:predicted O-linked N-acetylglucosamine transferase (SPINDLY family)